MQSDFCSNIISHMKKFSFFILILLIYSEISAQNHRDSIDVINYTINLSVNNLSSHKISGNTQILLCPEFDNSHSLKLDLLKLKVSKILLNGKNFSHWKQNDSLITFNFNKSINKKDTLILNIFYSGTPAKDNFWGGFYFTPINAFNLGIGMQSVPHSFGRAWFPCNDSFTDKAFFLFNITVPKEYTAACGGKLLGIYTNKKNLKTYSWQINKKIPPYLASVSIAKYTIIKQTIKGKQKNIPVQIFTFSTDEKKTKKTFINLPKAIKIYEKLFGTYPWGKIGYVLVNSNIGGMEHAENIAISASSIDGTTKNETLLYHELAHSWFGNLVTCSSSKDMWLNEGWATYAEALFKEYAYGEQAFKNYNRQRHFYALNFAHINDNGYRAIANMNINYTYGTTVYKKGADVIHTLRYYIGDSLFFNAVKKYLKLYAYKNANTLDFKNALEDNTGINLDDFFDFWVFSKEIPFFEINKWNCYKQNSFYSVKVKMTQRTIGGNKLANSNKIEIFFMDSTLKITKKIFKFSGDSASRTFKLYSKPKLVMADINEHICDASVDKYKFVSDTGLVTFNESLFDADIKKISDTSFLRVSANFIEPQHSKNSKFIFQKNYYWTIEGLWNKNFAANGIFYFTTLMDKNFQYIYNPKQIILLYRQNPSQKWHTVKFQYKTNYLQTKLKTGQYCFAIKK